ncbi:adenylyl-sulfate kinase [Nocardioides jishulii]|uniref:adenylyl-sulfate kinase n=1 Tax=Nocardioides jishulii TaxID=2575440 RepID=UPI001EF157DB|nr:adenylyl-sulfate kinase [Nocardioides jishulii]
MSPTLPQHCPSPRELDDLELLLSGALAPRTRFDDPRDPDALVTLDLPEELRGRAVELVDPEGLPLARVEADGSLTSLSHAQYGPFRRLHLTPAQARSSYPGRSWIPVDDALTTDELNRLRHRGAVVLLALTGVGTPRLSPVALVRATVAAAKVLPDAVVVAVPLAAHGDAAADARLRERVVTTYANGDPVWPLPPRAVEPTLTDFPAEVAEVVRQDRPAPADQGLVLFFTGLSGSGKSTLARALMDRVLEQGRRTVTSLDGDVVRRNLSAGLTFSKADRETNIRRIGWVAAEIARHGGLAVCSPIAPFAQTRAEVREMVESAGGAFFLVHVATPVEECERRDRKGLYAKARRGEIPEFTGISSPYEAPTDASVVVDTTGRSIEDALDDVVQALAESGLLDVRTSDNPSRVEPVRMAAAPSTPAAPAATAPVATEAPSALARPQRAASHRGGSRGAGRLTVLFVCTANVCRSPFMEMTAQSIVGNALEFASTGTEAKQGRSMDPVIAEFLPEDVQNRRFASHPVTAEVIEAADLVLTAETSHADFLTERHPQAFRKIFTLAQWTETVQGSDLGGRHLIEWAGQYRVPSTPEHDISDPYRRGRERAQVAAARITTLLQAGLPPLTRD